MWPTKCIYGGKRRIQPFFGRFKCNRSYCNKYIYHLDYAGAYIGNARGNIYLDVVCSSDIVIGESMFFWSLCFMVCGLISDCILEGVRFCWSTNTRKISPYLYQWAYRQWRCLKTWSVSFRHFVLFFIPSFKYCQMVWQETNYSRIFIHSCLYPVSFYNYENNHVPN